MGFQVIEGDVVIRDSGGNAIGVLLDGTVYRLQVEAKLVGDEGDDVAVSDGGQPKLMVVDMEAANLLNKIEKHLGILLLHMQCITEEQITSVDRD